ncbi:bifunctional phosphoribosyl-AMP cyclohydrolase/phosphoribosyl-ATP diphosphatase HisIE [candidate division KSB1 bacterium]
MLIPSIDLMDGKAVQLKQGKEKVLERDDVFELAKQFSVYGEIAVIDLDAAMGRGNNFQLIKKLCRIADCRVGGGIRTIEGAKKLLSAGAKKVIIGTKANPKFLAELPKDRIIIAIDAKEGFVMKDAWTNKTSKSPQEKIIELDKYCSEFLFTDIDKEGLMKGVDIQKVRELQMLTKNRITYAGGIKSTDEIKKLERMRVNSQLGMALYKGIIDLNDAFILSLDFRKNKGLIPTIVQDSRGQVLMMAFSNKDSLKNSLKSRKATYFSRSRKEIWIKGETSGNFQDLLRVKCDCDRDTLLFIVKQQGVACHEGDYSCFGQREFSFKDMYSVVKDRVDNPSESSYTSKLNESMIKSKIIEEANEVVNYTSQENLVWEIADLAYFVIVLMAKKGIAIRDVRDELWKRKKS